MKTMKIVLAASLAAVTLLSACTKDPTPSQVDTDPKAPASEGTRVIAVSFAPQSQTKTYLGADGLAPYFTNDDKILLVTVPETQGAKVDTQTVAVSVDPKTTVATITTTLSGNLKALYPAKKAAYVKETFDILVSAEQSGKFEDANICQAEISSDSKAAVFTNMYALFKIKSPDASQKLTVKSLPAIGADGQRTGNRQHINGDGLYSVTVSTPILAMPDSIYYVAVIQGVKLSDLSFETESWEEGTGSIKGIPTSVLQNQAKILNKEYNEYNVVASGTAYTIDGNNWHEYVEIDGRKWATMNVGATSPEQQGYYFSWGNTEGHWLNGTDDGYVFGESEYGSSAGASVFTDITGNVKYDAASANWGGAWRMPAIEELRTLISLTTKEPVTDYNSTGYIFSDGGNSLFFPKAIAVCENEWCDDGGYYWSSTYNPLSVGFSPCLYFYSGCMEDSYDRYLGIPVRAIIDDGASAPAPGKKEIVLWEGEAVADDWKDQPYLLSDVGLELEHANATVGQEVRFYITAIDDNWKLKIHEGHWGPVYCRYCSVGNDTEDGSFTEYDLDANGGYISLTLTQEMLDAAFTQQWWGGTFVADGDNVKITKITLY